MNVLYVKLTGEAVWSCQKCDEIENVGDKIVLDGVSYRVLDVVSVITDGKRSYRVVIA